MAFQMEQFIYQKESDQKFETMLRDRFEQQRKSMQKNDEKIVILS